MKIEHIKLDKRLSTVASFVRKGIVLYDVGSDHAYLPALLLSDNTITYAYVCDIADGPIKRATNTVKNAGVQDKVKICKTDGLKGIDILYPCDVSVAGMGGELIAAIIDAKPQLKNHQVRLILQPMTKQEALREYLSENGFFFEKEVTVTDGKFYTVIVCGYDGVKRSLSDVELLLGKEDARTENDEFYEYARAKADILKTVCNGKIRGGADPQREKHLVYEIEKILDRRGLQYDS